MERKKIVRKFFTKVEAVKAKNYLKLEAKKSGVIVSEIEIIDACKLFRENNWRNVGSYKSLGLPVEGQFMIIVRYGKVESETVDNVVAKPKVIKIEKTIRKKRVFKSFMTIRYKSVSIAGIWTKIIERIIVEKNIETNIIGYCLGKQSFSLAS